MKEPLLSAKMLVLIHRMVAVNSSIFILIHVRLPVKMLAARMLTYVATVAVPKLLVSTTRTAIGFSVQIQHFYVGFHKKS